MNPNPDPAARERVIVRVSLAGIAVNVALAAMKAGVGLLSHSIAAVLDALNNLTDALSSIIAIIGAKLSRRAPDREHPLGHARAEYITATLVAALVLYAGITALIESVRRLWRPADTEYTPLALALLALAVGAKLALGRWVKRTGRRVESGALVAAGQDALSDALLSASVLGCAILRRAAGLRLEAWAGAAIAIYIIHAGVRMVIDTLNQVLGRRTDDALANAIRATILEDAQVLGAADLYLFDYGPGRFYGSVRVEVDETLSARQFDALSRRVQARVEEKHGVMLTGIGLHAVNPRSAAAEALRRRVSSAVLAHDYALELHGFSADTENKRLRFDVVLSFDCDHAAALEELTQETAALCPGWEISITPDMDVA